jgi:hypothetical protein
MSPISRSRFEDEELVRALRTLRLWPRLSGFRGNAGADLAVLAASCARSPTGTSRKHRRFAEIEINPLRVMVDASRTSCVALDVVALRL